MGERVSSLVDDAMADLIDRLAAHPAEEPQRHLARPRIRQRQVEVTTHYAIVLDSLRDLDTLT
ncbi:hypothetical protein L3Q67_39840 [Saccharothrix sp. AJ9571]|nr:hypothetical protein L3Q67_39840 [Saccharothrix sp. AJ9571]